MVLFSSVPNKIKLSFTLSEFVTQVWSSNTRILGLDCDFYHDIQYDMHEEYISNWI